ncbi:30S ribosomal protein S12 methylthiotransferase RimO [Fusibacter sp. JL216-2]|uniref:30S ribosomal protein S12 methylthiotransferase RimO n=1 Tax=Fusibacter sp. JL216-2 TaxID=3071453 RepID=UPI003D34A6AC
MELKVYFETLGCAKNQVDTEVMVGIMSENKYFAIADPQEADVIVINTCGFIESAKTESVETILDLSEYKEHGKCKALVVTGCLAERYAESLKAEIPEVDAFVGTTQFDQILPIVEGIFGRGLTQIHIGDIDKSFEENLPRVLSTPKHMAYLKISEGCDNLCTYCIIPKLRGKYRSRHMEDIVLEAQKLVAEGVKELIIIAQDTTRYGIDLYDDYKLAELLEELNKIEGLKWIRLQYMYPDVIDEKLIGAIASLDKVVKYVDMPIQHASDSVLKRMNRRTDQAQIRRVVTSLRDKVPHISIRTTLIVGFPGETKEEYEALKSFVEEMKFDRLGVFAYSQEEDTPAAKMPGQVEEDIKSERRDGIMATQISISEERMNGLVGQNLEVVIEEVAQDDQEGLVYIGRSSFDAPEIDGVVYVHARSKQEIGSFVHVNITDALEYDLIGEI